MTTSKTPASEITDRDQLLPSPISEVAYQTVEFVPANGSAIDPLVEEATWFALAMTSANPGAINAEVIQRSNMGWDCLVEACWQPGRAAILSEVDWDPNRSGSQLAARLAVGVFGPRGTTRLEASGLLPRAESAARGEGVFTSQPINPAVVVTCLEDSVHPPTDLGSHVVHLSQSLWSLGDDIDVIEIVSRFNPTIGPWSSVVDQLSRTDNAVRVRATVLATELSPADRLEMESGLRRVQRLRDRCTDRPEVLWDAERAQATLLDLRASLSSPALVGEIAICSHVRLPDTLVRSISAAFTSQSDVLRRQGHVVVATNRLVLGGFELRRNPPGWAEAQARGVPLRGGMQTRELRDLITLTESPIGWPLPWYRPLPSIPREGGTERPVPTVLDPKTAGEATPLGTTPRGRAVALPLQLRTQHLVATGTWGAGKSTLLFALALADLRAGRPFLFIDPHGSVADRLADFAAHLDVGAVVVDPSDGNTDRIQVLPQVTRRKQSRLEADRAIRRMADATASSLIDESWTGPRWFSLFEALLEVVVAHRAELHEGIVWFNNAYELRQRINHPAISPLSASVLASVLDSSSNETRSWVSSKLHALVGGDTRRIFAPAGKGTDPGRALIEGKPVIVNLAGMTGIEANVIGHVILAAVLDAAMERHAADRSLITCYIDEVHRFPAKGIGKVVAEGRKFGIGLAVATQSLGQLSAGLADLVVAAGTQAAFRATPDTAARLASVVGIDTHALIAQPDLQATVAVQGHPPTTVVLPPYETCPTVRTKALPTASRSRRPKPKPAGAPSVPQPARTLLGPDGSVLPPCDT